MAFASAAAPSTTYWHDTRVYFSMGYILFSGISLFHCFINMTLPRLGFGSCGSSVVARGLQHVLRSARGREREVGERERERFTMICTVISGYISRGLLIVFTLISTLKVVRYDI